MERKFQYSITYYDDYPQLNCIDETDECGNPWNMIRPEDLEYVKSMCPQRNTIKYDFDFKPSINVFFITSDVEMINDFIFLIKGNCHSVYSTGNLRENAFSHYICGEDTNRQNLIDSRCKNLMVSLNLGFSVHVILGCMFIDYVYIKVNGVITGTMIDYTPFKKHQKLFTQDDKFQYNSTEQ